MYYNTYRKYNSNQNHSLPFFGFHNEMGNLLNTILKDHMKQTDSEDKGEIWFKPSLDILETKTHYIVITELAGVEQKDIVISIEKNVLTISGEKKNTEINNETTVFRNERNFGKFNRSIEFPEKANPEVAEAEFKDGVLTIKIEKYIRSEPKKIEIRTA